MNLRTIIRNLFRGQQKEQVEQVTEWHDDSQDFTHEVMAAYEETVRQLSLHGEDISKYDVNKLARRKERERLYVYKLPFEPIPREQNFKNVRSYLHFSTGTYKAWQHIRNNEEVKAGSKCSICKGTNFEIERYVEEKGKKVLKPYTCATECHERWEYDEDTQIQRLVALISICVECHNIFHANMHLKDSERMLVLFDNYSEINNVSHEQCQSDFTSAIDRKKSLDGIKFKIDMSVLHAEYPDYGFDKIFDPHTHEFDEFIEKVFTKDKANTEE